MCYGDGQLGRAFHHAVGCHILRTSCTTCHLRKQRPRTRQGRHSTALHRRSAHACGGACFRWSTSDGLPARQRQATHGTGHPGIPGTAQHHHNGLASFKSGSEPHRALVGRDSAHDQPTPCSRGDTAAAPPGRRGQLQQRASGTSSSG